MVDFVAVEVGFAFEVRAKGVARWDVAVFERGFVARHVG
jgi:hypothetical protein